MGWRAARDILAFAAMAREFNLLSSGKLVAHRAAKASARKLWHFAPDLPSRRLSLFARPPRPRSRLQKKAFCTSRIRLPNSNAHVAFAGGTGLLGRILFWHGLRKR